MAKREVGKSTVRVWILFGVLAFLDLGLTAFALLYMKGKEVNPLFSWLGNVFLVLAGLAVAKIFVFLLVGIARKGEIGKGWYKVRPRIIPFACVATSLVIVWNITVILGHL